MSGEMVRISNVSENDGNAVIVSVNGVQQRLERGDTSDLVSAEGLSVDLNVLERDGGTDKGPMVVTVANATSNKGGNS